MTKDKRPAELIMDGLIELKEHFEGKKNKMTNIYVVQIGDDYGNAGSVVYAGMDKHAAECAASRHQRGDAIVRWSEWVGGIGKAWKKGVPTIEWEEM